MRDIRWKPRWNIRMCMLLLGVGLVAGILYENLTYKTYEDSVLLFEPYYLEAFLTNYQVQTYFWSVLRMRLLPFVILLTIGHSRVEQWIAGVFLASGGFLLGMLKAIAIIQQGLKGLLLYISMLFPHGLFYGLAYSIVLSTSCIGRESRWNTQKILVAVTSFAVGMLSELYVMPSVLRFLT